ncbi:MAG TPA: type II/IV secretion system protein [Dehalococcoidia bacterium]|jgi:general secretion pathway protein E|nr:type II/IV secretion system protein [Dehalococcoidia bacterium]
MELAEKQKKKDIGQLLVEAGIITEEQLERALELQQKSGNRLEQVLLQQRMVTPQQLAFFTSMLLGIPFINLRKQGVKSEAVKLVPESIARKYGVIPVDVTDGALVVAMEDPKDIEAIEDLAAVTLRRIEPVISTSQDIQEMIDLNYRIGGELEEQLSQIPTRYRGGAGVREARVSAEAIAQAPVVRAIDLLIKQAVRDRASDIHIEPQEDKLRVRYRIDGILSDVMSLPLSVHAPLLSRLKIMAGLNIAERRRPQDGQITFDMGDREVDIRVATANTIYGEMTVLRILDKAFAFMPLPEIGFTPDVLSRYMQMLKTPFGMILISGPTGSGKTTTQYASVNQLDAVGRKIITIEDPVEYHFANINQIQVNPAAGVTFASGLRACMRLDPDVILVGEIRDAETAQISTQAALTGHLVLSSVHANDTANTVIRMLDLGIEPFLISSALIGVVAQRMVRRVCPYCSRPTEVSPEEREAYEEEMHEKRSEFIVGAGCNFCAGTGYLGRTGIFEVMVVSEPIRRMIVKGANSEEIRAQARKEGMVSLWHDGMLKVKAGITTPYEVLRNVFSIS